MSDKMKRKPRTRGAGRVLAPFGIPASYRFGDTVVNDVIVYHVADRHPDGDGPWEDEADKTAWIDEASGLPCIIRRSKHHGALEGFVAVPRGHDLFGFDHAALAPLGIIVHGGLNYSEPCQENELEAVSVCHVEPIWRPIAEPVSGSQVDVDEDLWWLGFSCDHSYDYVPKSHRHPNPPNHLAHGHDIPQTYRDEAYVHRQVVQLAAQLKALGDGDEMPAITFPPPPIGLERTGGRSDD